MAKVINLPKIGVNMTEAIVVEWVVSEGDETEVDQHIVTMETDKAAQDMYSSESGVILKILKDVGEKIVIQDPLYIIGERGEDISQLLVELNNEEISDAGSSIESPEAAAPQASASVQINKGQTEAISRRIKISPLAKKIAKDNNIDFSMLSSAAPGLRIVKKDVKAYLQGAALPQRISYGNEAAVDRELFLTGIRRTIAERMTLSATTIPSAVLNLKINAEELIKWKKKSAENGNKIGFNEIIIKAAAKTIEKYPMINARFDGSKITVLKDINIGAAVDTEKGLMVPVIHNANNKGVLEISSELRQKAARARSGQIKSDDLNNGTFTITNLGMLGIEQFVPIINPPQCAILAVGSIEKDVVVDDTDQFQIQNRLWLTLVFDHRIIDGAPAGKFLRDLKRILEWPLLLAE